MKTLPDQLRTYGTVLDTLDASARLVPARTDHGLRHRRLVVALLLSGVAAVALAVWLVTDSGSQYHVETPAHTGTEREVPTPTTSPGVGRPATTREILGLSDPSPLGVTVLAFQGPDTTAKMGAVFGPVSGGGGGEQFWHQVYRPSSGDPGVSLTLSTRLGLAPVPCDGCAIGTVVDLGNGRRIALGPTDRTVQEAFVDIGEGWYPVALRAEGLTIEQILDAARQLERRPDHGVTLARPPLDLVQVSEYGPEGPSEPSTVRRSFSIHTSLDGETLIVSTALEPLDGPTDPLQFVTDVAFESPCVGLRNPTTQRVTVRGHPAILITCPVNLPPGPSVGAGGVVLAWQEGNTAVAVISTGTQTSADVLRLAEQLSPLDNSSWNRLLDEQSPTGRNPCC